MSKYLVSRRSLHSASIFRPIKTKNRTSCQRWILDRGTGTSCCGWAEIQLIPRKFNTVFVFFEIQDDELASEPLHFLLASIYASINCDRLRLVNLSDSDNDLQLPILTPSPEVIIFDPAAEWVEGNCIAPIKLIELDANNWKKSLEGTQASQNARYLQRRRKRLWNGEN